jgi:hypothetical protein
MINTNEVASWSLCNGDGSVNSSISDLPNLEDYYFSFCDLKDVINGKANGKKVVYCDCMEPDFLCASADEVIANENRGLIVLSRRKKILGEHPNSSKILYGDCWLDENSHQYLWSNKKHSVSFTTTSKSQIEYDGYALRHAITQNLGSIKKASSVPFLYYGSTRMPLLPELFDDVIVEKRDPLFSHMFHLAVENFKCDNYFTEKLIDCFISKTIPIYFGTDDISEYFNKEGMILVDTIHDVVDALQCISPDLYKKMLPAAEENYETAKKYCWSNGFISRMANILKGNNK